MEPRIASVVIGCGRMGAFTSEAVRQFAPPCWFPLSHVEAIRLHPELELRALCDADAQALERACAAYQVAKAYTDYREILEDVRPQLIGIATRTIGRAAIIQHAMDCGVRAQHVEKPLCNSMRELEVLEATFARPDLFFTYGAIRRHFRIYEAARALAYSGTYGSLQEIRVNMGTGALYWTHPHSVDLILYIAGARTPAAVQSRLANFVQGDSSVDILSDPIVLSASIYFPDGLAGHIGRAPGADLVLSCTRGEITVVNDGQGIHLSAGSGTNPYPARSEYAVPLAAAGPEGTFAPVDHLVRCLRGDMQAAKLNESIKQHILAGQRILFAMAQSHLERSRLVELGNVDPGMTIHAMSGERFA